MDAYLHRWSHRQGSMQTQFVTRLLDSNADSIPLLMLRGHAHLLSTKFPAALRCYTQVRNACKIAAWSVPSGSSFHLLLCHTCVTARSGRQVDCADDIAIHSNKLDHNVVARPGSRST